MTKYELFSFVMVGLVPAICKLLICVDTRHKAEDDDGEASGLSAIYDPLLAGRIIERRKCP